MERFRIQIQGMENQPELMRTLTTLFSTRACSQPADRDFGISWECLDEVPEVAESLFCMEAEKKVARYEPRVQIEEITFETGDGELMVQLFFSGREKH